MNDRIIVSCVVLCYRNFENIFNTIYSILHQDYKDIELIISDDGSENFPEVKIRNFIYNNSRSNICNVQVIHHNDNIGTVKNFNYAINQAKGMYIIPVSCNDELYENDTIAKIVDRLKKTSANLLVCRRLLINANEEEIGLLPTNYDIKQINKLQTPKKQYLAFASQMYYDMASGSCTYYNREFLIKRGLFDTNYRLWEDGPLYLQYTREGYNITTAYDIVSCKYRLGGVSTKGVINPQLERDYFLMIKREILPYISEFSFLDRRRVKYISQYSINKKIWNKIKKSFFSILYLDAYLYRRVRLYNRFRNRNTKIAYSKKGGLQNEIKL